MASLDSSMPPSTLCSATTSCGGVRSNSPRDPSPPGIVTTSATLTCALLDQSKNTGVTQWSDDFRMATLRASRACDQRVGAVLAVRLWTPRCTWCAQDVAPLWADVENMCMHREHERRDTRHPLRAGRPPPVERRKSRP